jgi:adenylate cyclase
VNTGEVIAGVVGGRRGHRKHGIVGDPVNVAARLQAEAPVGEVVIGEGTIVKLGRAAVVEQMAPRRVKGKEQPVHAYLLRRVERAEASQPSP